MTKKILIIALALLMVAPIFADAVSVDNVTTTKETTLNVDHSTLTKLDVEMKPSYQYTVTATALTKDTVADWDGKGVDAVRMERNGSTESIQQLSTETYYVSYKFYEYGAVTLQITTDHDLQAVVNNITYSIPFTVSVEQGTNNFAEDTEGNALNSNPATATMEAVSSILSTNGNTDAGTGTIIKLSKATDVLGDYAWGSIKLTVGKSGDNDLKGKPDATYTANIVLKVIANA
jgi:hypothetical protein